MQTMKTPIWAIGSTSKGRGAGAWEGGFAKVWLPNPRVGPDCKIIQSPMPLGCLSNDPNRKTTTILGPNLLALLLFSLILQVPSQLRDCKTPHASNNSQCETIKIDFYNTKNQEYVCLDPITKKYKWMIRILHKREISRSWLRNERKGIRKEIETWKIHRKAK